MKKDKPILTVLASLAKALVFDLCLNKPFIEPSFAVCLKALKQPYLVPTREKTLQERRAVLACFLLTSQYVAVRYYCFDSLKQRMHS